MDFVNELPHESLVARQKPRDEDHRGYYFRDITAIIHSYPFRRLKHKTQVFFAPKNDHICTRIEHVMHVATISATICRALDLDVDLAWAISLGHDLGHTPFGHVGEKILGEILAERDLEFLHEIYSLRVVDKLAGYGKGLNLTYAVRDGIISHCGELFEQYIEPDHAVKELSEITTLTTYPGTWEGTVMRMSDKVAYLGRDLEDAIQLGLVSDDEIPEITRSRLGTSNSEIIDTLVNDIISSSAKKGAIGFSDAVFDAIIKTKDFNYEKIYLNPILANYHKYFKRILTNLYEYLEDLFSRFGFEKAKYHEEGNRLASRFGDFAVKMKDFYHSIDGSTDFLVADYVAGMTDDFAIDCISEIMIPRRFETQFDEFLFAN